jgi:predicted enzyme related to lactoylglutathione lyase
MLALLRFHIRILTDDFPACFQFYRDILELPVRYGDEDQSYAEFKSDVLHIALFDRASMAKVLDRSDLPDHLAVQDKNVIVLRVSDVDQSFEQLKQKGVSFVTPPVDHPEWGCRTAHFSDPAGTLFELNADL